MRGFLAHIVGLQKFHTEMVSIQKHLGDSRAELHV